MNRNLLYQLFFLLTLLAALLSACNDQKKDEHAGHQQEAQAVYTCPMHPDIIRNAPGSCPICSMDLVKKGPGAKSVGDVELEALLKPANAFVIASVPVTTLEQREEDVELNVVGIVAYDTRQLGAISSRVNGRIERLYLRYKYQPVKKGQKVMELYSPELVTAQQNLLFLLKNDGGNTSLIKAAKDRLLLLGMTRQQVAAVVATRQPKLSVTVFSNYSGFVTDLPFNSMPASSDNMQALPVANQELAVKEGAYVQSGQAVFSVYNADRVWVLLDIFPEQQQLLQVGDAVRIVPETAPQQNFRARIDYIEPVFRGESKTLTARVYFNNTKLKLPVGSRVTATVFSGSKSAVWLPREAVLSLGRDRVVFRKEGGGFRAHLITTGIEQNNLIQVTGGIEQGDSVAVNAQFLVDNETFIKVK